MQTETPADKGAKIYGMSRYERRRGMDQKLSGSTSIVKMLMQYKNGETRGAQSALCGVKLLT